MAVAVKTSKDARSTGILASTATLSLLGLGYLLACLAIVFLLVPKLWWDAWIYFGYKPDSVVGHTLVACLGLLIGIALLVVGGRLLGPKPPVGVRAGVFVAFVGLLGVLLLARWASVWIEHWVYSGLFGSTQGMIAAAVVAAGLLILGLRTFFLPSTQRLIVKLEESGWFHATSYKANQGQKVRRGTILGLLLIVLSGIYTLISHNTLARGPKDWALNIPFTGQVAIDHFGDTQQFLADKTDNPNVEIRWEGDSKVLRRGEVVSFDTYRKEVEKLLQEKGLPSAPAADNSPAKFVVWVNEKVIGPKMQALLKGTYFTSNADRLRLETKYNRTNWEDLGNLLPEFSADATAAAAGNEANKKLLGSELQIPSAVLLVDRYVLRDVNAETDSKKVARVVVTNNSGFKFNQVVTLAELEKAKAEATEKKELPPETVALVPATGKLSYTQLTLLPSVQYTVPLLLLVGSLWLAWRAVNMPAFADFLIATEAELNKVSWTTQKKLVQDTIVVLVTVVLMAVFLFGMDQVWRVVLSSRPIGVLYFPPAEEASQLKSVEQKKW